MDVCCWCLIWLIPALSYALVSSAPYPHKDLHDIIASSRDDLVNLLGTDSISSVPEYEVSRIHTDKTRRDLSSTKQYQLSAFGQDLRLELTPSNDVVSPSLVVMKKISATQWVKDLYTPDGQFYQGHVASQPHSHVAVREIERDGSLSGSILMDSHIYEVRPIPDHVTDMMAIKEPGYHVITRRSLDRIGKEFYPEPLKGFLDTEDENQFQNHGGRVRRELAPKYIEAMITMDKLSCDYYGNITMEFILAVANMVNRLYSDKSLGLDVTWTLTKVFLIQAYEEGLDFEKHKLDSAVRYLVQFSKWAKDKNTPAGEVEHWDNGIMLSRRICGIKSCTLAGVAYAGVPCSPTQGYTMNNAKGLDVSFYVAHEMGHNFGLSHDSGKCKNGYMMNAAQASGPKAFQWSPCSSDQIKKVFGRVKCYDNKPPSNITLPVIPGGHEFDSNQQCRFLYGDDFKICPVTTGSCDLLFCYKNSGCTSSGTPPIDGTTCGHRKWCVGGQCVEIGNSIPPAIDGGWSRWGGYTACSRTCGGGIQHRYRECTNPSPQNHGRPCKGLAIGEWRICNTHVECPPGSPHYRTLQCLAINKAFTGYWGSKTCHLWCRKGNVVSSEGNVADGTRFNDEPRHLDICIRGQRKDVGCDGVLHSKTIADRCAKCLGNGSTCINVNGSYTKDWRRWGPDSADPIVTIPAGSTHFYIKENAKTKNVLNIKLLNSKRLLFPNRPTTSTRNAAGTVIKYSIHNSNLHHDESMEFEGPTTQALVVVFVYVGFERNVGYKYSFRKPGKAPPTKFVWKTVLIGSCSVTCAGGVRPQTFSCHREDDQSEISTMHCDALTRPKDFVPCNTQACPPRWDPEPWGRCTHKCGGGKRTRVVPCLQQVKIGNYQTVRDIHCNSSAKPHQQEDCNLVDCAPVWVVGEWSKCAQFGSRFLTRRRVGCQSTLANGTSISVNKTICLELTNVIPESEQECTLPSTVAPPPTDSTSTTKTITIIAEREIEVKKERHDSSTEQPAMNKPWLYGIIIAVLVVIALVVVLVVLYRYGKLPCKAPAAKEHRPSMRELQPLAAAHKA